MNSIHAPRRRGFTLIELLVVVSIIALLIGILLPTLTRSRTIARQIKSGTHVRGIHSALVLYGGHTTNRFYPGIDRENTTEFTTATDRLLELASKRYVDAKLLISPMDLKVAWDYSVPFTTDHFSYALLKIEDEVLDRDRRSEWQDTANARAIVLGDRNVAAEGEPPYSVNSGGDQSSWYGNIAWNDNHITWETSDVIANTQYGVGEINGEDALFADDDLPDNANLVFD